MQLWPTPPWKAIVRRKGKESEYELRRPVALIGGHTVCDVRLKDKNVPDVAYLAVFYAGRVEVWPTSPLAFAIWGRVSSEDEMLVGRSRVRLVADAEGEVSEEAAGHWRPQSDLVFDWGEGEKRKSLSRPITILGQDHPSLIRLHGTSLHRCDHGIICFGDRVWLVELHPDRLIKGGSCIQEIAPEDPSIVLSGIHVWCAPKDANPVEPRVRSEYHPETSAKPDSRAEMDRAKLIRVEHSDGDVDELTTEWTDSLLHTIGKRERGRQSFRWLILGVLGTLSLLAVAAIVIWGVVPIIRSIYQW